MGIEEKVRLARKTKDEKLISDIISHYKPIFLNNVCKEYGEEYKKEALIMLSTLVNRYIYDDSIKSKLSDYLRKKVFYFPPKRNFNNIIKTEDNIFIKEHYIKKMYSELVENNLYKVMSNNELKEVCKYVVNLVFNNYLNTDKSSFVSIYFNTQINRRLKCFKDEEKLIIYYVNKIGIKSKMVNYFVNKYKNIFEEYSFIDECNYCNIVKEILSNIYFPTFVFEVSLRKKLNAMKNDKKKQIYEYVLLLESGDLSYYYEVKKYYTYIIDCVYNKFKDDVLVDNYEYRKLLNIKYDKYFKSCITFIQNTNTDYNISRYMFTRLNEFSSKSKKLYPITYVDSDLKKDKVKRK